MITNKATYFYLNWNYSDLKLQQMPNIRRNTDEDYNYKLTSLCFLDLKTIVISTWLKCAKGQGQNAL